MEVAEAPVEVVPPVTRGADSSVPRLLAIEDSPAGPPSLPNGGAVQNNQDLEDALQQREERKAKPAMKKPSAAKARPKGKVVALKRPSAASSVQSQPAAKHSKGPIPSKAKRLKLKPNGCSKCRERKGCCDSCWIGRGFRKG